MKLACRLQAVVEEIWRLERYTPTRGHETGAYVATGLIRRRPFLPLHHRRVCPSAAP
jgi:hypothetical protein